MLAAPECREGKAPAAEAAGSEAAPESERNASRAVLSLDVADESGYEGRPEAGPRQRILIRRSEAGWTACAMPGAAPLAEDWNLEKLQSKSTALVVHLQTKSGLKVRLVQPIELDDEGDPVCSLVCLASPPSQRMPIKQTLQVHVELVEKEAGRLAEALLEGEGVANAALRFAAKWHDEGKKSDRWQRYIGRQAQDPPLGKAAEWRDPGLLAGYRHEFGSLLRIPDEEARRYFAGAELGLSSEQRREARDLALHMIAAHHAYARPHFAHPLDNEFTAAVCERTHSEAIRRFGRLQRRYGRWGVAYLESLLRAADWAASRVAGNDPEVDDDDEIDVEEE
jgi:hypothetical protein